jgi:acetoin utilization deacetylase AcuC-like enzyme
MIVYSEKYLLHNNDTHPENNKRLKSVMNFLTKKDAFEKIPLIEPSPAKKEDILRVHTKEHLEFIANFPTGMIDADTYVTDKSYEVAMLAAGGVITCVDQMDDYKYSFALVRPPGHHAEKDRAMGFCLFNNLAVGAGYAIAKRKIKRVFILDFDLHHGNGTQDIFQSNTHVLFASLHQYPFYPGTGGIDEIKENIINIPLPPGTCNSSYLKAIDEIILPVLEEFKPKLVFVSAGYDAHHEDPLGGMKLTTQAYYEISKRLVEYGANTIFVLEGGYNLSALARCVYATLIPIMDLYDEPLEESINEEEMVTNYIESRLQAVKRRVLEFWDI